MAGIHTRAGRVVVIWLLSLLAAVVCFGFLHSSGVVDNGVVQVGGAFAGFLVTVLTLDRVWGPDALQAEAQRAGSDFTYEEVLKALDLRRASPTADEQLAPLTDYYRVRRLGAARELHLHYATTADGITWQGSATHPTSATWRPVSVSHVGPDRQQLRHEYEVDLSLGDLAPGQVTPVITNVVYRNAFRRSDGEWFETHLEQPTGRLTMIMLAPDDMRVTAATAGLSVGLGQLRTTPEEPAVLQDGSVVYWATDDPVLGARYALRWTWVPRAATGEPRVLSAAAVDHGVPVGPPAVPATGPARPADAAVPAQRSTAQDG